MTNLEITNAYVGDTQVEKIYLGTDVVWGGSEPEPIYSAMPLTFNIISAGTILWRAQNTAYTTTIEYSLDSGETWTSTTSNTGDSAPSISVNAGDVVQFRGDNATYATGTSKYNCFCGSTAIFEAKGNIMSLIYSTGFETATTLTDKYAFLNLFRSCTGLTSAENLVLPATTLADNCYDFMFYGCRSLVTAPELPATTLADNCYSHMFTGCRSLVTAPTLPATTLAQYCYNSMFNSCTSLTQAPELPATTLAQYCYTSMFNNCTSLTQAPELPVTTLTDNCYYNMFGSCTNLTQAPVLPATTLAKSCYSNMFYGCTSLTSAPELPATTLTDNCYVDMFRNCASLNYIKALITSPVSSNLKRWVTGVASSGTFVKHPNATWTTGDDGIPSGWTVVDADI